MLPESSIPIIGLTGPTGAGKSTAAAMLESLGCGVIDGDILAREVVAPGSPLLQQLAAEFGSDILWKGDTLDRALLAERAFSDEAQRRKLGNLMHPAITALALTRAKALQHCRAIVFDAAALAESEFAQYLDVMILITAPDALRLSRIVARDGISEAQARLRMNAQSNMCFDPPPGVALITLSSTEGKEAMRHSLEQIVETLC